MDSVRELLARFRSFFRKRARDEDFDAELSTHLDLAIQDKIQRGMSAEEARRRALISIGGMERARELHRESRGLPALDTILQDLRHTVRTLRRDAGLTTFAILIIGLGVGASSTVFNVFHALFLRPLPFEDPARLVWIANGEWENLSAQTVQVGNLLDFRAQSQAFSDVAGYSPFYGAGDIRLSGAGEPERLTGVPVTEDFFRLLGVEPQLGRLFTPEECRWNAPKTVVLSHGFWQRRFAADPGVSSADLAAWVRAALKAVDPNLPATEFRTMRQLVDQSVFRRRSVVLLLAGFAGFGLILASLGIYGVISYSVSRRRHEIGIRMALGASAGDLQTRILMQTARLALVGMILGASASWMTARALQGLLFGVTFSDPVTFAAVIVLLAAFAVLAGYLPARRASRLNPLDALRCE